MNAETAGLSRRYRVALRDHLAQGQGNSLRSAYKLGREAAALGLETLDLARIHQQALPTTASPGSSARIRRRMIARANMFFVETIVPIEKTHRTAVKADIRVEQLARTLRRCTLESSVSTCCLKRNIRLRRRTEQVLKKSRERHARLLAELHLLQKRLRDLKQSYLTTQEDVRQNMSFRLHAEIAQSLIAIDLRLLTLKRRAMTNKACLQKEIANTQRLVKESATTVGQFVHEFGIQHGT